MVHMIHVPKTGGESADRYLRVLNGGSRLGHGFDKYKGETGKGSPHQVVKQDRVRSRLPTTPTDTTAGRSSGRRRTRRG